MIMMLMIVAVVVIVVLVAVVQFDCSIDYFCTDHLKPLVLHTPL